MDVPRPDRSREKKLRRLALLGGGALLLGAVTLGVSRLKPAAPTVERATVWIDTVKRGPMLRQVRGAGTLVPEEIRWIPSVTEARVEKIVVRPGAQVTAGTVLLEMSNPEVERDALDAEWQLKAAEADLAGLTVTLESRQLDQQASAASVRADYTQAQMQAATNEGLAKDGLVSDLTLKLSKVRADEMKTRNEIEEKRLAMKDRSDEAQLSAQRAKVEQLRGMARLRRDRLEALKVRAGMDGVLQQVPVEVGQRVAPGTNVARVADPNRLKAEVRVPETQAKDVVIGQRAEVDTRNGVVEGRVVRIDPAVQNGTVTVEVTLVGELPRGARPDLSVDGTIEIERLPDVTFVGRPAFGQEKSTVGLFKLVEGGKYAVRVPVKLGKSSVNTVEVVEGLNPGDQVVLSELSAWDAYDRIRLN